MNFFKNKLLVHILNESCFASVPPDVREDATREKQNWGAIQEKREGKVGEKSPDPWAPASLSPHRGSPTPTGVCTHSARSESAAAVLP